MSEAVDNFYATRHQRWTNRSLRCALLELAEVVA